MVVITPMKMLPKGENAEKKKKKTGDAFTNSSLGQLIWQ